MGTFINWFHIRLNYFSNPDLKVKDGDKITAFGTKVANNALVRLVSFQL